MNTENKKPTRTEHEDPTNPIYSGITLRDYFANSVLQAIITNETVRNAIDKIAQNGQEMNMDIASRAYATADAMLKQREL